MLASNLFNQILRKPRNNLSFVLEKKDQEAELLGSDCRPNVGGQSLEKYLLKESIVPCEKPARQMTKYDDIKPLTAQTLYKSSLLVPAHCISRCALGREESKLLLAKESNMHGEISVSTIYKHLTLKKNEGKLPREQLSILITADSASDHIDFPLRNSFSTVFLRTERLKYPLVKFGKSRV